MDRRSLILLALSATADAPRAQAPELRGLLEQGRFVEALRVADATGDPASRTRSRVEALYAAGDITGAFRDGREGLRAHPEDPVLLWRVAQIALALRAEAAAEQAVSGLERGLSSRAEAFGDPGWWRPRVAALRSECDELARNGRARERSVARARWTVAGVLSACLAALVLLSRGR